MIQYGLDLSIPQKGFFTLEESLVGQNLRDLEGMLGFETGRLKHGADIMILEPPIRPDDFDIMATTLFPGHRFEDSNLYNSINSDDNKQKHLGWFKRKRIAKLVPLIFHYEALEKYLTQEEYRLVAGMNPAHMTFTEFKNDMLYMFRDSPETLRKLEQDFLARKELFERQSYFNDISDKMYPTATGGQVYQWKLARPVLGRCVCRMTDYSEDRYHIAL